MDEIATDVLSTRHNDNCPDENIYHSLRLQSLNDASGKQSLLISASITNTMAYLSD